MDCTGKQVPADTVVYFILRVFLEEGSRCRTLLVAVMLALVQGGVEQRVWSLVCQTLQDPVQGRGKQGEIMRHLHLLHGQGVLHTVPLHLHTTEGKLVKHGSIRFLSPVHSRTSNSMIMVPCSCSVIHW